MPKPPRIPLIRLLLVEGVVIALGAGLLGLLDVVACLIDPQLFAAGVQPPTMH